MNEIINQRNKKQKYLREQILDKGHDAQDFSLYLAGRKDDGRVIRHERGYVGIRRSGQNYRRVQKLQAGNGQYAYQRM